MILQGRNLQQGLTGTDVLALQTELVQLGYAIPANEQQGSSFDQGTRDAVLQFQTAHGLAATGVVDATTAAALGDAVEAATYTVTGSVWSPTRAGIGGLGVQLVDKYVGADSPLARATTDPRGSFRIVAVIAPASLRQRRKAKPDLQVRVSAGQQFLAASTVAYDAARVVRLDVILPAAAAALPSEYETLTAALATSYDGPLGALQETADRQDITYLANKTGWDARAVALAALADQFAHAAPGDKVAAPAATPAQAAPRSVAGTTAIAAVPGATPTAPSAAAAAPPAIRPEFYYALFRAGLPANPDTLYQVNAKTIESVWQQALAAGVIPANLKDDVTGAVQAFQSLAAARALDAPPFVGLSTLKEMVQATVTDAAQQHQFAQLYVQYQDDHVGFWSAVEKALGAGATRRLQLDGQLGYLTLDNAPLMRALHDAERQTPLSTSLDLAQRGYHDPAKWQALVAGVAVPAQIPGANAAEQRANYAGLLAAQVRLAFPTVVVADLVRQGKLQLRGGDAIATAVHDFLTANQGKFEIGIEPVEAYLARTGLGGTAPPVVTELKRLQRVYQLTPDDQSMAVLLQHQLDSAFAITRYDRAGFLRSFGGALGGSGVAGDIHARAQQIHGAVLNIVSHYLTSRIAPQLGGRGDAPILKPQPQPPTNPSYPIVAYPTLEGLFGPLDYCSCDDCRSILSPAAYLVDLLHYIDIPSPTPGHQNPQDVLFQRRPDLQYLPLTCENTNTALPYIDIVNETLEYFVSHNLSLAGFQGYSTDDTVTSATLLATPQNVDDAAYAKLQSAFFPPPLPFQRPLALLRLHLQTIGVPLPDAMTALRADDAIERANPTGYGWRDILMEQLGLSREEYRLFTDSTIGLNGLYGYETETAAAALATLQTQSLQDLSRRVGVSYDDLVALLQTRFINPSSILIPRLERLNMPFTTLQKLKNSDPTVTPAIFKGLLPAGIDARAYGGQNPGDLDAIVAWVTNQTNYDRLMAIIAYTNPANVQDFSSASELQLRYTNPDPTANKLRGADFLRLLRFIRLWQKLALSIGEIDDIIAALYPAADLPTGASDDADFQRLDQGFLALLPRIGFLYQVTGHLGLSTDTLGSLLACWAPIGTTGSDSLYAQMFLTPSLLQQDPAFAIDPYGDFLQDPNATLAAHEPALCAAFNLSSAEFDQIMAACGFSATTLLTLANISALYRMGWLAHTLQLSIVEFLLLRQFTGLDPFATLDPSAIAPAEPPVIRFVRLVQAMANGGLLPVQALYLLWNQDISGKSVPPLATVTGLASTLRANFAAVESQFRLVDDPDGSIAKGLTALVYGATATDFFFGLLNGTLATTTAYASPQGAVAQPILDAAAGRLGYDDLRKELTFAGVLDAALQAAIDAAITANDNDAALHAALGALGVANHQSVDPFFAVYPELLPLYQAYVAGAGSPQDRRTALLANFLPSLKSRRKAEQALAAVTAAAGTDPSFAATLLQDATILHAATEATDPAVVDFTAIETPGLTGRFYLANNPGQPPDQTIDAVASLAYAPGSNPLPPGQGGGAVAGSWTGYVVAPQDGFYNVSVATDAGAAVTLQIDGASITMAAVGTLWSNQSPISLTAGALTAITLSATGLTSTLVVNWESFGLGWQPIPGATLYSATLIDALSATYTRFLKATASAGALALAADEIAWLATATASRIATTDGRDKLSPGTAVFRPMAMANISPGAVLLIDRGPAQETVTVTATTPTSFTAVIAKPHDGTTTPFPIVGAAMARLGRGWLNFLASTGSPDAATAASLRDVLAALLDFAAMKAALSPTDGRLLAAVENPGLQLADGSYPLLTLSGWSLGALQALLQRFFGDAQLAHLGDITSLRRVYDAYAVVSTCRIAAAALIAAMTNDPSPGIIGGLQSALRARYAEADWLTVVKPINDTLRQRQRDALVAYVLQRLGDQPATADIDTADKLLEYFLIDVETEPPVETSRIRLALSAVQLFIERSVRNLEKLVAAADFDPTQWTWMKRYRVWEANREIFLWPENWLYPELRDDQSPIFQQMMSDLLQGDITNNAAEAGYLTYLTHLEEVAKLEPCGIFYVPTEDPAKANDVVYVVARTAGLHRKHYFRQLINDSWTPWTEMKIDAEDLPVTPIVWNGRLLVFWLKIMKQTPISASDLPAPSADKTPLGTQTVGNLQSTAQASAPAQTQVTVSAALCWSEYYNGKWQGTKSSDVHRPTGLGTFDAVGANAFDDYRDMLNILPVPMAGEYSDALVLSIASAISGQVTSGFVLYNTHSLPIRWEDAGIDFVKLPDWGRWLQPWAPYTGGKTNATFGIVYWKAGTAKFLPSIQHLNNILDTRRVARYVESQPGLAKAWDAPFLYEDRRNVFYVTTEESLVSIWEYDGFGIDHTKPALEAAAQIPPLVLETQPKLPDKGDPITLDTGRGGGDAIAVQGFVTRSRTISAALGWTLSVTFDGRRIGIDGSMDAAPQATLGSEGSA
jgi:peptidoglycan hydrolase-like protein with peptidoglycan-binding domain